MREIKNLVFEGGGVLGMAYAGALVELEKQNILQGVERVAGTSAGALFAMLVSLRYNTGDMKSIIDATDFKSFEDHHDPFRIVTKYGLYKGDYLLEFIQKLVKDVTGNESITFEEMAKQGYHELKVFACDLNTTNLQEFSLEKTPKAIVAECVRASMSIPLFFRAWQFPSGYPNDHIYVDGGTIYNYPISAFDNFDNTLGFFFDTQKEHKFSDLKYDHVFRYVESVFSAVLKAQKISFRHNQQAVDITVFIDTKGVSPTDFKLSADKKEALFESGMSATRSYIENLKKLH